MRKILNLLLIGVNLLFVLAFSTYALEEWQDHNFDKYGIDSFDSKMMVFIPQVSDTGYKAGGQTIELVNSTDELGNFMSTFDSDTYIIAPSFTTASGVFASGPSDVLFSDGSNINVYRPAFGEGGFRFEYPDPRSPITCYDFDGDFYEECIGVNFQAGELVVQVFQWNTITEEIIQMSVNALDGYEITNSGPISCNNFAGASDWRCLFIGYNSGADSTAKLITLLKNSGDDQFFFGENETLVANQSFFSGKFNNNRISQPMDVGGNEYYYYPHWHDRIYLVSYDTDGESLAQLNNIDLTGPIIGNVQVFNDFRRASSTTENFGKYNYRIGVAYTNVTHPNDFNNLDIYSQGLTTLVNRHAQICKCSYYSDDRIVFDSATFLYDLDGDGRKDFFTPCALDETGGNREGWSITYLNSTFDSTGTEFISTQPAGVVGVCSAPSSLTYPEDVQIVDYADDGDNDLFILTKKTGYSSGSHKIIDLSSETLTTIDPDAGTFRGAVFADFTGDGDLDLLLPRGGDVINHLDGETLNFNPSFTFNNTATGCGFFGGNSDNVCNATLNTTIIYEIIATDPESDQIYFAYDCDNRFNPVRDSVFTVYNSTNKYATCTYLTAGANIETRIWVDDQNFVYFEDIELATFINISFANGRFCNLNSLCENVFGEDNSTCPEDCEDSLDVCNNDSFCIEPENILNCPADCDTDIILGGLPSPKFYTDSSTWWEQYQISEGNDGRNTFNQFSNGFWDANFPVKNYTTTYGDGFQSLVTDFDGDVANELMLLENGGDIRFYVGEGDTEAVFTMSSIGLTQTNSTSTTIRHSNNNYIVFVDNNRVFTAIYDSENLTAVSSTSAITGGVSKSGIKCKSAGGELECFMATDNNNVARIDVLDGSFIVYTTNATLTFAQEKYREPSLKNIDAKDDDEFLFTTYDSSLDKGYVVAFDLTTNALDLGFNGGFKKFCTLDFDSPDYNMVISNPLVVNADGAGGRETVVACAAYESFAGVSFVRGEIYLLSQTGSVVWVDEVMRTNEIGLDKTVYLNSSSANKYMVMQQPVLVQNVEGISGDSVCWRLEQLAGATFELQRAEFACYSLDSGTRVAGRVCGDGTVLNCTYADDIFNDVCTGSECYELVGSASANLFIGEEGELINNYGVFAVTQTGYDSVLKFFTQDGINPLFGSTAVVSVADLNDDSVLDVVVTSNNAAEIYYTEYANIAPELVKVGANTCNSVCGGSIVGFEVQEYNDFEGDLVFMRVDCLGDGNYSEFTLSLSASPSVSCVYPTTGDYIASMQITDTFNKPLGSYSTVQYLVKVRLTDCFTSGQCAPNVCADSVCSTISGAVSGGFDKFGINASLGEDSELPDNYVSTHFDFSKCNKWRGFKSYIRFSCPFWYIFVGWLEEISLWSFENMLLVLGLILIIVLYVLIRRR